VTIEASAQLSPGTSIGTLTVDSVTFDDDSSELLIEVGGSGHDQLLIDSGAATLNGQLLVDLVEQAPDNLEMFTIVSTMGSLTGTFDNLSSNRVSTVDGEGTFLVSISASEVVLSDFQLDPLAGDYDNDNDVDGFDFLRWQRGLSPIPIGSIDLDVWGTNYGNQASPLATAQTPAAPAAATSQLIDAAIAFAMNNETTDESAATVYGPLDVEFFESNPAPSEHLSAIPTRDDVLEFGSANSDEAEDSTDQWLSHELLERVFG
jgi:hypothetical protein